MAGKNNKRYKLRKRMNSIKHEPIPRFSEPAKLIETWSDLVGLESDRYTLDIDVEGGNGYTRPKFEIDDSEYFDHNMYLSTHTFYGQQYFYYTEKLRDMGFNIQLENWDGETRYSRQLHTKASDIYSDALFFVEHEGKK